MKFYVNIKHTIGQLNAFGCVRTGQIYKHRNLQTVTENQNCKYRSLASCLLHHI